MLKLRVPATTANLGPGMDAFGLALNLFNTFTISHSDKTTIMVQGFTENLPTDTSNFFYRVLADFYKGLNTPLPNFEIVMENNIPPGKGLGSSASVIIGALVAGNMLLNRPYGFDTILSMAAKIEGHPDNVAPALYGGMVIAVESSEDIITHHFDPPQGLKLIAVIPDFQLPTRHARQILPKTVPLKDAIYNVGRAALVTAALKDGDYRLLSRVMEDKLHQQYRTVLIPGMEDVFTAAKQEGAFGAVLSGAGPTLIAFADGRQEEIGLAMQTAFLKHDVKTEIQHLEPAFTGAEILDV